MAIWADFKISSVVAVGVAGALTFGFSLPSLFEGGSGQSGSAAVQKSVKTEAEYCAKNLEDVNCACFAQKAGQVQSHNQPQVFGFNYADKEQLARGQAARNC